MLHINDDDLLIGIKFDLCENEVVVVIYSVKVYQVVKVL